LKDAPTVCEAYSGRQLLLRLAWPRLLDPIPPCIEQMTARPVGVNPPAGGVTGRTCARSQ